MGTAKTAMKTEVRRDILGILKRTLLYAQEKDSIRLQELSNHTLHNASIFQDEDSITIAVIIYALAKVTSRGGKIPKSILELLKDAKENLSRRDLKEYSQNMSGISREIEAIDSRMKLYIQKVIDNAEIKKGSRIYEHGISLARASEMLGVSQWELMAYVGKTSILDNERHYETDVKEKIRLTRKIFLTKPRGLLVFDSGPIITLTLNHLMWLLDPLKKQFNGDFVISQKVKQELIDTPLETRKFKFEALHTDRYVRKGTIDVSQDDIGGLTGELMSLCNSCFIAQGNPIQVVHQGEIESLAIVLEKDSRFVVIDERTTRLLVEDPVALTSILQSKLHHEVEVDKTKLRKLSRYLSKIKVIRSVELVTYAYEEGLLDRYLPERPFQRVTLLDAVLWGLKLNGCAVTEDEIMEIIAFENHIG